MLSAKLKRGSPVVLITKPAYYASRGSLKTKLCDPTPRTEPYLEACPGDEVYRDEGRVMFQNTSQGGLGGKVT